MALYIVSTPIGNLKDISERVLEVLGRVDIVIAENVRDALRLLSAYSLKGKKIVKYNDRNKKRAIRGILNLLERRDAVYISSAGTPGRHRMVMSSRRIRTAGAAPTGFSTGSAPCGSRAILRRSGVRSGEARAPLRCSSA